MLVSVIIPVFNDSEGLRRLLDKLFLDEISLDELEVLVIDNNSHESIKSACEAYPVRYYFTNKIQSSYHARNIGIMHAKGEILAFIDSDCVPSKNWIKCGVQKLISQKADIVSGDVKFIFESDSVGEIYDSIFCIQNKRLYLTRRVAATANLFIKKSVFQNIDWFDEHAVSGGDIEFTARAFESGHKIEFSEYALVFHPARKCKELFRKMMRTASGKTYWKNKYNANSEILKRMKGEGVKDLFRINTLKINLSYAGKKSSLMCIKILSLHAYFLICGWVRQYD